MNDYLVIFFGGGLGASARYWLGGLVHKQLGSTFSYGTLTVNILGCILIGLAMASTQERFLASPQLRLFLTVGLLGGFTTFSSFSYETIAMLKDGAFTYAGLNIAASIICCLAGTWVGMQVGKFLLS